MDYPSHYYNNVTPIDADALIEAMSQQGINPELQEELLAYAITWNLNAQQDAIKFIWERRNQ